MENNQSYWFVVREDQSNVIFSSNNFTLQNPQVVVGQEARYIVDTGDKQYVQVEGPVAEQEIIHGDNENTQQNVQDTFWDTDKVKLLLTLSQEHKYHSCGKDKVPWNIIAPVIGTTKEECSKKFWNLRRTYLRCLYCEKIGKDTKWPYFDLCQEMFKDYKPKLAPKIENWGEGRVKRFLTLYLENMHRFYDKECLQKDVWKDIANILGTTEYNCYHKFKNLKKTYISIQEKGRDSNKIKWPYYEYFERISSSPIPKTEQWGATKVRLLIETYSAMAYKFKDPKYQKKELWQEIGHIVGESPHACDRKYRNLKHSYLRIKKKILSGKVGVSWKYYNDFEKIYNCQPEKPFNSEDYVKELLTYYIENKQKLASNPHKKKIFWRGISSKLGLTPGECDKKFRNLKQTYMRLVQKGKGNHTWWPYYTYFQEIFNDSNKLKVKEENEGVAPINEVKRVILSLQDKRANEMFDKLVDAVEESNTIQRERNRILEALLKGRY